MHFTHIFDRDPGDRQFLIDCVGFRHQDRQKIGGSGHRTRDKQALVPAGCAPLHGVLRIKSLLLKQDQWPTFCGAAPVFF
jgi:hypothetical protein